MEHGHAGGIHILKLEAAVRAVKEAAAAASTSRFVPVTLPAARVCPYGITFGVGASIAPLPSVRLQLGRPLDSEHFRFAPRTWAPLCGHIEFVKRRSFRRVGQTERDMMHPHFPSPLPVAVPDIGFTQSISIGPKALDSSHFADVSGDPRGLATQPLDRIVWLPSLRSWFSLHS
jgi:hypothetical protein